MCGAPLTKVNCQIADDEVSWLHKTMVETEKYALGTHFRIKIQHFSEMKTEWKIVFLKWWQNYGCNCAIKRWTILILSKDWSRQLWGPEYNCVKLKQLIIAVGYRQFLLMPYDLLKICRLGNPWKLTCRVEFLATSKLVLFQWGQLADLLWSVQVFYSSFVLLLVKER